MENNQLKNILTKIGEVNPKYDLDKQVYNVGVLIQFIENPSEEVQLTAVKDDPFSIKYIENPTEKVGLVVVERDPFLIRYIDNPSEKVKQLARSKGYDI